MESEVQSSVSEDTAVTAPAQADTPATGAPATGQGSEQGLTSQTSASTTPTEANKTPAQAAPPQQGAAASPIKAASPEAKPANDNWQQRYSSLQSETDKRLNQMSLKMQQKEQEFEQLRQFRQKQEEQANRLNLKPWSKQHPENAKFQGVLNRARIVDQQLRSVPENLPPEQKQALQQAIMSAMSPEDHQQYKQYREESFNFQNEFFSDPMGTLAPMLTSLIQEKMQVAQEQAQADMRVSQDFESPELKPLIQANAPEMQQALKDGVPYDYAVHMLRMKGQLEKLQGEMGRLNKDAVMGREQQRLAKGNATITRDPAPSKAVDVYELARKEAAKKGMRSDDPRFMKLVADIEARQASVS